MMTSTPEQVQTSASVEFQGVTFGYESSRRNLAVFREFDLRVERGEFVSIVGLSGCGKSTLLRLAAGLLTPSAGNVLVAGSLVTKPTRNVGLVFQNDTLLPWRTARKNVKLGIEDVLSRREADERADAALERVGLSDWGDHHPHQLSGGMRQRINLARAMAMDPPVLLMDEPFSALDAQTRENQQRELLVTWHAYKKSVLFVTHQIDEAIFLADRVVCLGPAPSGVVGIVDVNLSRPRDIGVKRSAPFNDLYTQVHTHIHSEDGDNG
jgi:NitT/TauT family transport system ATP-binding protein